MDSNPDTPNNPHEQPPATPHPAPHGEHPAHAPREHAEHGQGTSPAGAAREPAPRENAAREGHSDAPRERAPLREPNTIFIGKKTTMNYVLAVVTQFQNGSPFVKIKARGKVISQAVDVAEIVRRKFLPDLKVGRVSIATEALENEDHSHSNVSSIEIILEK